MHRPGNRWLGLALTGATLATAGAARAGVGACVDPRIRVEGELSPQWVDAIERACADLVALPNTDQSAHVRIVPKDRELLIEVTLADGRFASRRVQAPEGVRETFDALLIVPAARAAPPAAADKRPAPSTEMAWPPDEPEPARAAAAPAEPNVGIELGGGLGGRVAAGGYLSIAFDAFAEIRVGSWLLGTVFRWDFIGRKDPPLVDTFEFETVGAGLLVARRIALGFGALDVGVAPRLAVETQTYENSMGEVSQSTTDARLGSFARLAFGKAALRGLVALDAELSPSRLRRVVRLDPSLPALPAWSAGLTAGVMWAAP